MAGSAREGPRRSERRYLECTPPLSAPPPLTSCRSLPPRVELDDDLPAQGKYYCVPCARYFVSGAVLAEHEKSKPHKKRVKTLQARSWGVGVSSCAGSGWVR